MVFLGDSVEIRDFAMSERHSQGLVYAIALHASRDTRNDPRAVLRQLFYLFVVRLGENEPIAERVCFSDLLVKVRSRLVRVLSRKSRVSVEFLSFLLTFEKLRVLVLVENHDALGSYPVLSVEFVWFVDESTEHIS